MQNDKKHSIAYDITRHLLADILRGRIAPDSKLPPERELASKFNTNRNTLREAIRNLETLKLVTARQGDGLRVQDFRKTGELNLLPYFIDIDGGNIDERIQVVEDIFRFRRRLFQDVAMKFATNGTEAHFNQFEVFVDRQEEFSEDPEIRMHTDLDIITLMVDGSGSLASKWIFNTVMRIYTEVAFKHPSLWYFTDNYTDNLRKVLASCRERNPEKASQIMVRHLEETDTQILSAINTFRSLQG